MKNKTILAISIIALVLIIIFGAIYVKSVKSVEVKQIELNELKNITLEGFVAEGDVEVFNDGILPVYVKKIAYSISLDYSQKEIISGSVNGSWVQPHKSKKFTILTQVNWIPSIEAAQEIIKLKDTSATLHGQVILLDSRYLSVKFPFEKKFDLTAYFIKFFEKKINDFIATTIHDNIDEHPLFPTS